jgi:hypothetical protein
MGLDFAREKMNLLVHTLAVDVRPLPERLQPVFAHLADVIDDAENDSHLPDDLLAQMREVRHQLTARQARGNEGRLAATLSVMTPDEAHDICVGLVAMAIKIWAIGEEPPE